MTCGLIEGGLRIAGYEPLKAMAAGKDLVLRRSDNPDIGYELIPGAQGRAFKTDVHANSFGFRSPEPATGDDIRRVLFLGDSITFGSELPAGTVYPDLIAEKLEARDPRFDVQNLALSGYDTLQENAVLERHAASLAPELVVLGYCLNDAGIVSANLDYLERMKAYADQPWLMASRLGQLVLVSVDRLQGRRFEEAANDPENFNVRYAEQIESLSSTEDQESPLPALMRDAPEALPSGWYRDPARVGRLRHAFEQLAQLRDQHGFRVVVVVFPFHEAAADGSYPHGVAHAIVAHELKRAGLPVIDLLNPFARRGLIELRNDPDDPVHPSPEGHRIAADVITEWLEQRHWL